MTKHLLCLALVLASCLSAPAQAVKEQRVKSESSRQVADAPLDFFGPFKINGETPAGFENFDFFALGYKTDEDAERDNRDALVPDKQGAVPVRGQLVTVKGSRLDFETVRLVEAGTVTTILRQGLPARVVRAEPVSISFTTIEVSGVRYAFVGQYLGEPAEESGAFTYLQGVLRKFKNGKLAAEAKVGFVRVSYSDVLVEGGG